jgi:lipopolysaccharide export system protein LptA
LFLMPTFVVANDSPIEVTADNELTWNQANKTFVAKGNALITQGVDTIGASTITAHYNDDGENTVIQSIMATPDAILSQQDQKLTAQKIHATFNQGALDTVTATNNVVLTTPKETLKGDKAVYNAVKRTIILTGNVRIEQGRNILVGSRAEFDLNTNISTLTASPSQNGGRVKATFFANGGAK